MPQTVQFGVGRLGTVGLLMLAVLAPVTRGSTQAAAQAALFEAASIKQSSLWRAGGEGSKRSTVTFTPSSLTMENVNLSDCVEWAYGVNSYQVSVPDALNSDRYDIMAKTGAPVAEDRLRTMLQALLATRFRMVVHPEMKVVPVYELVVAKNGPKLPPAKTDGEKSSGHSAESLPRVQNGSFVFENVSMADFAAQLSLLTGIDRPVVDRTGIGGVYDITLNSAADAILHNGASPMTLVQEQLGLKMAPARDQIEIIVVEHAVKPLEN